MTHKRIHSKWWRADPFRHFALWTIHLFSCGVSSARSRTARFLQWGLSSEASSVLRVCDPPPFPRWRGVLGIFKKPLTTFWCSCVFKDWLLTRGCAVNNEALLVRRVCNHGDVWLTLTYTLFSTQQTLLPTSRRLWVTMMLIKPNAHKAMSIWPLILNFWFKSLKIAKRRSRCSNQSPTVLKLKLQTYWIIELSFFGCNRTILSGDKAQPARTENLEDGLKMAGIHSRFSESFCRR